MRQGVRSSGDDLVSGRATTARPLLIVHTGDMKGKSTAAFGLALRGWNQGWRIGVFHFARALGVRAVVGERDPIGEPRDAHALVIDRQPRRRPGRRVAQPAWGPGQSRGIIPWG